MTTVETERLDGIGIVRLNRPARGNALSESMPMEITDAIAELSGDKSVAGVVLTGAGRLFCAGGDVETLLAWQDLDFHDRVDRFAASQEVVMAIRECPVPVVAAVNGPAAGAGVDLALACDLRIAAEAASFTAAFAAVGLVPDLGGSWSLNRLVGTSRALRFLLSGERLTATDALAAGLVDQVVEGAGLVHAASAAVKQITGSLPRSVVTETLLAVRAADVQGLMGSMQQAARVQARLMTTAEHQERIAAYLPKGGTNNPNKENQ